MNWSIYRKEANGSNPNARQIKVFAQPAIKTTQQWVLYAEGDVDALGQMRFYSFDTLVDQKMH